MADSEAVARLLDWAWFPVRSEAGWRWLARTPRSQAARALPLGWVVEVDGEVSAMVGNFTLDYQLGEQALVGATGHTLIVHPRARGASRALIHVFAEQPGVFGGWFLNANARSAPLYPRQGFEPCPPPQGNTRLVWPVRPVTMLAERLIRSRPSRGVERLSQPRVFADLPDPGRGAIRYLKPETLEADVDGLWADLVAEGRLLARRDAASLRWRMSDPDRTCDPLLVGWYADDRLAGYALAQIGKMSEVEAPVLTLIDLIALGWAEDRALPALVGHLVRVAPRLGVSRVRLPVVTVEMTQRLAAVPGMVVRVGHVSGHARFVPGADALKDLWRPTPYDGDFSFCLRHPPRPGPRPEPSGATQAGSWRPRQDSNLRPLL